MKCHVSLRDLYLLCVNACKDSGKSLAVWMNQNQTIPGKITGHILRVFYRMAVWKRLMIALSAVARNSGPIALILLWGTSKSHSVGGGQAPYRTSFWVPFNRWALKLSSISWPASSKNMNGFHQLPALSPSKKTFTVGKTMNKNLRFMCIVSKLLEKGLSVLKNLHFDLQLWIMCLEFWKMTWRLCY